jgi:serine/threonine protein kinase
LQARLADGPLELKEILRIGFQTASGLAAAHAQGLIHRDVKPANILLENSVERVKLTDFGLARAADEPGVTRPGIIAGTPEYMAPEQTRGERIDVRADLFSLGVARRSPRTRCSDR